MRDEDTSIAAVLAETIATEFTPSRILHRLLLSKFKDAGLRLSPSEKKQVLSSVEEAFRTGDWSKLEKLPIERQRRKSISINLTDADIKAISKKNAKAIQSAVPKALKKASQLIYKGYVNEAEAGRAEYRHEIERFQFHLARSYGLPFRSFGRLLVACINTNNSFLSDLASKGGVRQTAKRVALLRLHHRACRVSTEIESLFRAGLGDGAMARWRTLHEICVTAVFISERPNDVARRFLHHEQVDRAKIERVAMRLSGGETKDVDEITASLRSAYGKAFTEDCGWASKALGIDRVKFSDLERAANFGHARLEYQKANSAIHASSLALHYRPSLDLLTEPGDPVEWTI